ncbi:molybdopterin-binding protein [Nocardia asteroides]|uniref:molybdopterin-binding protein n=1 Tax=Nocardia asteroides TaxID=1824 RepID=UPI0037C4F320
MSAAIVATEPGVVANLAGARSIADEIGLAIDASLADGDAVAPGDEVMRVSGSPLQILLGEERLIGALAKPSGIATATRKFVEQAGDRLQVVSGAWKKLPLSQKEMIRSAITTGGAAPRIAEWPFMYLDKNFVRILGGVADCLRAVDAQPDLVDHRRIIQIGDGDLATDACIAAAAGAGIVFIDTGNIDDIAVVSARLEDQGLRSRVALAFGGGVQLDDIKVLAGLDVDIVDVGRPIVDAPLLDMRLRVTPREVEPEWDLLEKTEIRIERIGLDGVNLNDVATLVADELGVPHADVLVIDARDDLLALDILRQTIDARQLAGRGQSLIAALGQLPGVKVSDRTTLCSEGVLGWLSGDREQTLEALERSNEIVAEIQRTITSRAVVYSTGPEVIKGQIEDTNKPWIMNELSEAGFRVSEGQNLPDDIETMAGVFREAGEELGYGLVVTTGGVGAEGKDGTVEALLTVDPNAATPYLFHVEQGHGRHAKPGVRIGVGTIGSALVVNLPGPHSEATLGTAALIRALRKSREPVAVAAEIADALRSRLRTDA